MELPYWHEAEAGSRFANRATGKKVSKQKNSAYPGLTERLVPENGRLPFPRDRWPTKVEAEIQGYSSLQEWYVDSDQRRAREGGIPEIGKIVI